MPDRLRALLTSNVVPFPSRRRPLRRAWMEAAAIAASLVLGVAAGTQWRSGPLTVSHGRLVADGSLDRALDTQLAGAGGATRILASFRAGSGSYCRVFTGAAVDGIACRDGGRWAIQRTQAPLHGGSAEYRQAASGDAALMAAAQDMMADAPLDAAAERRARAQDWRPASPGARR